MMNANPAPSPHTPDRSKRGERIVAVASLAAATTVLCLFALLIAAEWPRNDSQTAAADTVARRTNPDNETGSTDKNSGKPSSQATAPRPADQDEPSDAPAENGAEPAPAPQAATPRAEPAPLPAPRPWHEVAWRPFDTRREMPQPETLKNWFEPVVGQAFEFHPIDTRLGRCGQLHGNSMARLKQPFDEHSTLRLELDHYNRLRIHLYHGLVGVTLVYYEQDNYRWAAYSTMRGPKSPLPTHAALTSTDDSRARRTEVRHGGPLELRYQAGEVILSRGDVTLVRASLPGPPEDVYFQGQIAFQGIEWERTEGFPRDAAEDPVVWSTDQPEELDWKTELGRGAWLEQLPGGALALIANQAKEKSHLTTPLAAVGICEVTLRLEDATPGTGVFLQSADGRRDEVLRFVRNSPTGRTCLMLRGNDDGHEQGLRRLEDGVEPCVGQQVWVRMLFGCGTLRWWISADGRNWAEPEFTRSNMLGNIAAIGVQHVANRESARIHIHGVAVRRLDRLSALSDPDLLTRAHLAHDLPNLSAWFDAIAPHRPASVRRIEWQLACAVKSLAVGPRRELGHALIAMLLDSERAQALPVDQRLDLLNEAARLIDVRDDAEMLQRYQTTYLAEARTALNRGQQPFSLILPHLMTMPVATRQNFKLADPALIRAELLQLLDRQHWDELGSFIGQLRFYHLDQQFPLVDWAEATARRESPALVATNTVRMREAWQHPLVEQLNKSTYNLLNELRAMLDSDATEDAARLLTSIEPGSWDGVASSAEDTRLLTSLPTALAATLAEHDGLRARIGERHEAVARLRIRQAINRADEASVRLAAVQFEPTSAATEAYRWLGDQTLMGGWFEQAEAWYRRERLRSPSGSPELQARLRMAAALQGKSLGEPVVQPVTFGDTTLSAGEFEAMIGDLTSHRSAASEAAARVDAGQLAAAKIPEPGEFQSHHRARLDGLLGEDPRREVTRHVKTFNVDWAGRQVETIIDGDSLLVANRFQIAAYDLNNGQRRWHSPPVPNKKPQFAQAWTSIPMRPLVTNQEIYARMLYGEQPCLVCLNKSDGTIRWTTELPDSEAVASDPLLVRNQLLALTASRSEQQATVLRLVRFDRDSGQIIESRELLQLRDSWWQRRNASLAALEDGLLVALSGAVVSCDARGEVRWIRKQVVLPTEEDADWVKQHFQRPLVLDNTALVFQPGVATLEAIDLASGRLRWSRLLPDAQRIIGARDQRLLVETGEGILSLSRQDGSTLWEHALDNRMHGMLLSDERLLLSRRAKRPDAQDRYQIQLVWLDVAEGKETGRVDLPEMEDADPRFGPLVAHGDRLWGFFGRGQTDPARDLMEIGP